MDAATLATMKTEWLACLSAIATAGQNYTIAQRTFTRANLSEVKDTIAEIQHALEMVQGQRVRVVSANFNPGMRE